VITKRLLYFFPHNPYPPRSGAHNRCLAMLKALKELGCEVTLASSSLSSETPWTQSSIEALEGDWVSSVRVHRAGGLDRRFIRPLASFYRSRGKSVPITSAIYTPPSMRIWFAGLFYDIRPAAVILSYAHWDGLVRHGLWRSTTRVVDTLDFMTLNIAMRKALAPYLPAEPIRAQDVDDGALQEDFYERLQQDRGRDEPRAFARYTWAIAISEAEADLIRQEARHTRVVRIPVTQEPRRLPNSYAGAAIFPTGPNPFNIQGYCYFVKRVLPKIQHRDDSFRLQVTGYICDHVHAERGVTLSGFLPDLQEAFTAARFMICPVFGGTGQQIKIIEAMAHGLPVVALDGAARGSPIAHGVNGFTAKNAEEFAGCTLQLWQDEALCRRLGEAARETIASECSPARLRAALGAIVGAG
jgi:glycosyltransferase involved in cell wall biosynthesis